MTKFSENLKKLRKEKGWSQKQLSDISCISIKTIQNYEQDRGGMQPTLHNLMLLADIFSVTSYALYYGGQEEMSKNSLYMNELLSELKKLKPEQIIEIHDSEANGISLPNLSITDSFVSELGQEWKKHFENQPNAPYKSYVERTVIRYAQNRQQWKKIFELK